MRLIDADKINPRDVFAGASMFAVDVRNAVGELIKNQPTVDAVEVVRCKDCIRRDICRTTNTWAVPPNDDWFCADGKRKEVRGNVRTTD